jgi:phage terminase small subunit
MKYKCPSWLSPLAKAYWKRTVNALSDRLNDQNITTYEVLCETYADWREAAKGSKERKNLTDAFIRLATNFGMTPRSDKLTPKPEEKEPVFFGGK